MDHPSTMDDDLERELERLSPQVRAFIDALIEENARLRAELADLKARGTRSAAPGRRTRTASAPPAIVTPHHPDTVMVITITARGRVKRTPLNAYPAQRRGGIGIYGIRTSEGDPVRHLVVADERATLLVLTSRARAFRIPVAELPQADIAARGNPMTDWLSLTAEERITVVLPLDESDSRSQMLIATERGWVRKLQRRYVGPSLHPGTLLYDPREGGGPVAATLSDGTADVFMATAQGQSIRFSEKVIPLRGALGIRLKPGDSVVGLCPVTDAQQVLLISRDGKGTRRLMEGFAAQGAGGQGKIAMKTDELAVVAPIADPDEVLCISEMGKIIRFPATEVPARASAVQGVSVIELQRDRVAAAVVIPPPPAT